MPDANPELFRDAADDPGHVRHRRQLLRELAANPKNRAIADLARDLLAGRTTPAEIMASGAYQEEFSTGASKFGDWYGSLSDEDRQRVAGQARAEFDRLADEPEPPESTDSTDSPAARRSDSRRRAAAAHDTDDEDFSGESWFR